MCLLAYADSEGPDQPAHPQSNQDLYYPLTESLDTIEYMRRDTHVLRTLKGQLLHHENMPI